MPNGDLWEHKPAVIGPLLLIILLAVLLLASTFPAVFAYAVVVVAWLAGGAAIFMVGYVIFWFVRNKLSPITKVRCRVARKRMKDWDVTIEGDTAETAAAKLGMLGRNPKEAWEAYDRSLSSPDVPRKQLAGGTDYFVTFAFNGKELELTVPESAYLIAEDGIEGLLVFQGEEFKEFFPMKQANP